MGLTDRLSTAWQALTSPVTRLPARSWDQMLFNGHVYQLGLETTMPYAKEEEIGRDFPSLVAQAYKSNGVIFACILTRLQVFSQARFQWQSVISGKTGDLFGTTALSLLEHPWPGATTGDLLTRMLVDVDLAGNAFVVRQPNRLRRMRPDWVSIIVGSPTDDDVDGWDLEAEVIGYVYHPGGRHSGRKAIPLLREQVAHFAPIPDPTAAFRGMSWLTPIIRETMADSGMTAHKLRFLENGATPNLIVKRADNPQRQAFDEWVEMMEAGHAGVANAYKTLYLTAGADATPVGKDFQQLEFKATQGAGETRIAAAAGVHPVIVGLSEGLQGSSLNVGNFGSARRLVADKTLWHLWSNVAGSLETIIPPPLASRLWIDGRIPFLREDRKDAAEIQRIKAASIRQLVDAGYKPESVVAAIEAEDNTLLKHSGLFSVQLQPAGTIAPTSEPTNGKVPMEA
jgi:phage portal protein BeeE